MESSRTSKEMKGTRDPKSRDEPQVAAHGDHETRGTAERQRSVPHPGFPGENAAGRAAAPQVTGGTHTLLPKAAAHVSAGVRSSSTGPADSRQVSDTRAGAQGHVCLQPGHARPPGRQWGHLRGRPPARVPTARGLVVPPVHKKYRFRLRSPSQEERVQSWIARAASKRHTLSGCKHPLLQ